MAEYDALCNLGVKSMAPKKIRALREKAHVSQAVFAAILNTSVFYRPEMGNRRQETERGIAQIAVADREQRTGNSIVGNRGHPPNPCLPLSTSYYPTPKHMAKAKTNYTCTECGGISTKWAGQCPACGQWNSLVETVIETGGNRYSMTPGGAHSSITQTAPVQSLSEIDALEVPRCPTGIDEFDRVLGGGLVAGGVVLIGGDPGIGKSTLLLQALANLSRVKPVLYVSGEESGAQIALRAKRLGLGSDAKTLKLQAEIQLEKILASLMAQKPQVAVIDSIQTLYSDALTSAPGSVARRCANARHS